MSTLNVNFLKSVYYRISTLALIRKVYVTYAPLKSRLSTTLLSFDATPSEPRANTRINLALAAIRVLGVEYIFAIGSNRQVLSNRAHSRSCAGWL